MYRAALIERGGDNEEHIRKNIYGRTLFLVAV